MPTHVLQRVFVSVVLACALGCAAEESDEDRIRHVIGAIEAAAQARDAGALKDHLSDTYKDAQGNDRRSVLALATGHFMRNRAVYVFARIAEVEVIERGYARAEALVALAGTPIKDLG